MCYIQLFRLHLRTFLDQVFRRPNISFCVDQIFRHQIIRHQIFRRPNFPQLRYNIKTALRHFGSDVVYYSYRQNYASKTVKCAHSVLSRAHTPVSQYSSISLQPTACSVITSGAGSMPLYGLELGGVRTAEVTSYVTFRNLFECMSSSLFLFLYVRNY